MIVIALASHHFARCNTRECNGCMLCHGGLALCTECGGFEGAMPTDCPGERIPSFLCDEIYNGALDYRRDQGWVQKQSKRWDGFREMTP